MVIVLVAIPTILLYEYTKSTIIEGAGKEARNIAITVANFIEADYERYGTLNAVANYETDAYDTEYYLQMLKLLSGIRLQTGADFIYTEKLVSDDKFAYVLDSTAMNSKDFSPIGSSEPISQEVREVFQGAKPISTGLVLDPLWGYFITGYAPIVSPDDGQVAGIVGVDFSGDHILGMLEKLRLVVVVVYLFLVAILSALLFLAINRLSHRMNLDFLTGLYNRRYFEEVLQQTIKRSKAKDLTFSLMIIDVDNFKHINDSYGHAIGDLALKKVAQYIRSNLEVQDLAFRYGGDEFSAILPNVTKDQAIFVGRRLSNDLVSSPIVVDQEHSIKVFVSIGLAEYGSGTTAAALIHNADQAMYHAKFSKLKASK
jgi:diguanylate cyclase (GGDEF)-like protein